MSDKVTEQDIKNWRWHYEGIDHDQMTGCDLFVLSCLDTIEAQAAALAERDAQLAACQARENALREAVAWYANEDNYLYSQIRQISDVELDRGNRARRALAGDKEREMSEIPERIYLQLFDDDGERIEEEATWCEDRINAQDVEYVSAAQLAACQEREKALRKALAWYAVFERYMTTPHVPSMIDKDLGDRARRALDGDKE